MGRPRWDAGTRAYMTRRTAEGKTKLEIIRCIKRYLARELYHVLTGPDQPASAATRPGETSARGTLAGQRDR